MNLPTFTFSAIGTTWKIDIFDDLSEEEQKLVLEKIKTRIDAFDKVYSRFRNDSLIYDISQKAGTYTFPEDGRVLFYLYEKMYKITEGFVTPLIGQVLSDAGYDAQYSLVPKPLTKPPAWEDVMTYEHPVLTTRVPMLLDFGAAGKGYLVDIVADVLEENGITSYCVDAGGDMTYHRKNIPGAAVEPLRVGLEHPADAEQAIGIVSILNESICGSAGNRRKWADFHHIFNPETLSSPQEIAAVWVVAENTMLADMLTTALYFSSPSVLQEYFTFEYLILTSEYRVDKSPGFNAELFVV